GGEAVTNPLATSTGARDPMWITADSFARVAGRALLLRVKRHAAGSSNSPHMGWGINSAPNASQSHGLNMNVSNWSVQALTLGSVNSIAVKPFDNEVYYDVAVVLRDTGVYLFIERELVWVGDIGTETGLYGNIQPIVAGRSVYDLDYF